MDIITKNFQAIKKLLVFRPPQTPPLFVLEEAEKTGEKPPDLLDAAVRQHDALLRYARRVAAVLEKARRALAESGQTEGLAALKAELEELEKQQKDLSPLPASYDAAQGPPAQAVSASLEENKLALEYLYNLPVNQDLIIRSVTIPAAPPAKALLAFIEGLVDKQTVSLAALESLMLFGEKERELDKGYALQQLISRRLPSIHTKLVRSLYDVATLLNLGYTAVFVAGATEAVLIETIGQEHRPVDRPAVEQSVRGSQSAFTETLRVNTGLVRSILRTNDLTTEIVTVGTRSNTPCALMYLKSIINPSLVQEAKRRIAGIKTDAVFESGTLQLFIEDHPMIPFPQALSTERPDRVAAALTEGRLAILIDGSPFAVVVPVNLFTLFHTSEDFAYSWLAGSFGRLLRLLGATLTTMLPSLYIAISYFHQEALPTDLILAIGGARERVPFPSILEIAAMEFAFELLREAGVRIPGMLGSTIGIVGAIILGQAAVSASIVSPITVVVIAVTGLASFAIPDYSLAFAIRLTRFVFEALAAMLGLVGVATGLIVMTVILCGMKSLGAPYLAPIAPRTTAGYDIVLRGPVYAQELRPDELSPQDVRRQASVSEQWTREKPAEKGDKP